MLTSTTPSQSGPDAGLVAGNCGPPGATPDAAASDDDRISQTLRHGLRLIEAFAPQDGWLRNAELARRTGLSRPTVSRLSATLVAWGYLRRDPQGRLLPGLQLLTRARPALAGMPIQRLLRPLLSALAAEIDGVVSVATLDRTRVALVEEVHPRDPHPMPTLVGARASLSCSAIGRALLSLTASAARRSLLATAGDATAAQRAAALRSLADCDRLGYCLAAPGHDTTMRSVGVPLLVLPNGLPLALNCATSVYRLGRGQLESLVALQALRLAAEIRLLLADRR